MLLELVDNNRARCEWASSFPQTGPRHPGMAFDLGRLRFASQKADLQITKLRRARREAPRLNPAAVGRDYCPQTATVCSSHP